MPESSKTTKKTDPAICVKDVTVAYGGYIAVDNVSFDIKKGTAVAIIGPNGSGKTSIIRAILGLHPVKSGKIEIFGSSIKDSRGKVGYVPQHFNFDPNFPITVREFMHLARNRFCPPAKVIEKIKEVGLMPSILDARLGNLSGGQLQRVLVAQAILDDPELLVMDEPATGIDVVGEATFYDAINHLKEEHKTTIVLVSHDIAVVSNFVDQVICLNKKLMCVGPPGTALTNKAISDLFDGRASLYKHLGHGSTTHGHHSHD